MQNLEKALKKNKIILAILIILVIVFVLYSIVVYGDIKSTKEKTERDYEDQMAEITEEIDKIALDKAEAEADIEKYTAEIEELSGEIAELNANLAAFGD